MNIKELLIEFLFIFVKYGVPGTIYYKCRRSNAMKVGYNDLDKDVQKALDLLRGVVSDYKPTDGEALVGYDGKDLRIKRSHAVELKKICSASDIQDMKNHLLVNDDIYESSFHKDYIGKNTSSATRLFKTKLYTDLLIKASAPSKLYLVRESQDYFAVLTDNGKLGRFDKASGKLQVQMDLIRELQSKFNLQTINIFNIQDIELCEDGLFIATDLYGIFYFDVTKKTMERKFKELFTIRMKYIGDGSLLCLTKNYIALYNLNVDGRIEKYLNLAQNSQKPKDVCMIGDKIFVLGRSYTGVNNDQVLYCWQKTGETILHSLCGQVVKNKDNIEYNPRYVDAIDNYLYVFGLKGNKVFAWRYDIKHLHYDIQEIIFEGEIDDLRYCQIYQDMIIYGNKEHLYAADLNGQLVNNFYLDKGITHILTDKKQIFVTTEDSVEKINLPTYIDGQTLNLSLLQNVNYNNVTLFLEGMSSKDHVKLLINGDDKNTYESTLVGDGLFIKIPYPVFNLDVELKLSSHAQRRGIIIKKDHIYM